MEVQAEKTDSEFPKTFCRRYFFVFEEYLCNCSPKQEPKNFKTYISILALVNHRNCLDASPLLRPNQAQTQT